MTMTPPDKPNPADKDANDPSSTKDAAVTAPSVPTPLETEEKMKFPKANQRGSKPTPQTPKVDGDNPEMIFSEPEDGFGDMVFPTSQKARDAAAQPTQSATSGQGQIDDAPVIPIADLTSRQLRIARRMATRQGLEPSSDAQAVEMLRARGIEPFSKAKWLSVVSGSGDTTAKSDTTDGPTDTAEEKGNSQKLGAITLSPETAPAQSSTLNNIMAIQRDIARRRRRKLATLWARLFAFVLLPTLAAGYYFNVAATPLYAVHSEFAVQTAEPSGGTGMTSMMSGGLMGALTDSVTVQGYLQSREAMMRLDESLGFKAYFSQPQIDPLRRLAKDATNEDAYDLYAKTVLIGYDPTEGVIKMEVKAIDPQTAVDFSRALIGYAEEQVDNLTKRVREDQMQGARESYQEAEANMVAAQRKVMSLQEKYKVISSQAETSMVISRIGALEGQVIQERLRLSELMANANPSQARVDPIRNRITGLEQEITELRAKMTESDASGRSLASIQSELMIAESDVATRQMIMAQALQSLESARIEANRQVRYLSIGVNPVAPDEAAYPRAFENTLVAFLIFMGIYLMLSMTASILREQVST
ncbi:MAG: capsule biosynthesis protein [Paracoccaceae bacterium]|nr:capsule biosynthesis protein [Paracoccaceae bacterium]